MSRRQTLALGAGGAALAAAAALGASRPVLAVFDGRYSDARRFAERAALGGAEPFDARADLARLWRTLDARPWRVIGLTTSADFGLGAAGGRERGMALEVSGLHDGRGADGLEHRLDGLSETQLAARLAAGLDWPAALAELMLSSPASAGPAARFRTGRAVDHPGTLISWRMA